MPLWLFYYLNSIHFKGHNLILQYDMHIFFSFIEHYQVILRAWNSKYNSTSTLKCDSIYAQIVFISSGKLQSTNHDSIHCTNVFHEIFLTFMIDITMCTDRIQGQWWILQQNSYQVLWNITVSLWIRESFWKGKIYQHL